MRAASGARVVRQRQAGVALVELIEHRLGAHPEDQSALEDVAMTLLADPSIVRRGNMTTYYWDQLARRVLKTRARDIARAIFAAQALRDEEGNWFIEHTEIAATLDECVKVARHAARALRPGALAEDAAPGLPAARARRRGVPT
jgi:hypothetical protein